LTIAVNKKRQKNELLGTTFYPELLGPRGVCENWEPMNLEDTFLLDVVVTLSKSYPVTVTDIDVAISNIFFFLRKIPQTKTRPFTV